MKKEALMELKRQWYDFINNKVISENTRPLILESWQRCLVNGIDPHQKKVERVLSEFEFKQLLEENDELIAISKPIMQNLYDFIIGSGFLVTLISKDGIILKIIGDEDVKASVKRGNFVEGADWSEKSAGTNAIGTSLLIGKPLQTFAYEHFCICSHKTTCSCSPIRDLKGNIIGALDLSGDFFNVNTHTLGMSVAAANAIENCLQIIHEEQKCQLANTYKSVIIDSISEGIIATDKHGNITHINGIATEILYFERCVLYKNIRDVLPAKNENIFGVFLSGKYYTDEEVSILTAKGYVRFTITSRPIIDDSGYTVGTVAVINELKRAKKIAQKLSGASAKLTFNNLMGRNKLFLDTIETAKLAASSNSNVLLLGESGTGKDVFAQAIHNESHRRNGPFVAINCGAIPKELIASELFGFVEGAFTGAKKGGNPGKFELADGGTIFLDEIGEMPLELQINLLRVLEQKNLTRIGGTEVIPIDVRIIAATNKNLMEAVGKGYFREDLFYRLNVLTIKMVPLRERKDDISLLIEHFYHQLMERVGQQSGCIPSDYLDLLQAYDWPGNIRELQNVVERTVNLSITGELKINYLPDEIKEQKKKHSTTSIEVIEKEILFELMKTHNGNITKVASDLKIARTTLYRKLDKYCINKEIFVN